MERQGRSSMAPAAMTDTVVAPTGAALETAFNQLVDDFRFAIGDPVVAHRLASLNVDAVLRAEGAEHLEVRCVLNGTPEVTRGGGHGKPDVEVTMPADVIHDFWERQLPMEILTGRVSYTGRVRRLLTIMPVIRAAVQRDDQAGARR